jgi:cysteinyl-tRNA synthetase
LGLKLWTEPVAAEGDETTIAQLMDIIIAIRQDARQRKDWATADGLRDSLVTAGLIIEDSPQGVRWKRK